MCSHEWCLLLKRSQTGGTVFTRYRVCTVKMPGHIMPQEFTSIFSCCSIFNPLILDLEEYTPSVIGGEGQVTRKHTTAPEQDCMLVSRRARGDISKNWRETLTSKPPRDVVGILKYHRLQKKEGPHHVWGHIARWFNCMLTGPVGYEPGDFYQKIALVRVYAVYGSGWRVINWQSSISSITYRNIA